MDIFKFISSCEGIVVKPTVLIVTCAISVIVITIVILLRRTTSLANGSASIVDSTIPVKSRKTSRKNKLKKPQSNGLAKNVQEQLIPDVSTKITASSVSKLPIKLSKYGNIASDNKLSTGEDVNEHLPNQMDKFACSSGSGVTKSKKVRKKPTNEASVDENVRLLKSEIHEGDWTKPLTKKMKKENSKRKAGEANSENGMQVKVTALEINSSSAINVETFSNLVPQVEEDKKKTQMMTTPAEQKKKKAKVKKNVAVGNESNVTKEIFAGVDATTERDLSPQQVQIPSEIIQSRYQYDCKSLEKICDEIHDENESSNETFDKTVRGNNEMIAENFDLQLKRENTNSKGEMFGSGTWLESNCPKETKKRMVKNANKNLTSELDTFEIPLLSINAQSTTEQHHSECFEKDVTSSALMSSSVSSISMRQTEKLSDDSAQTATDRCLQSIADVSSCPSPQSESFDSAREATVQSNLAFDELADVGEEIVKRSKKKKKSRRDD